MINTNVSRARAPPQKSTQRTAFLKSIRSGKPANQCAWMVARAISSAIHSFGGGTKPEKVGRQPQKAIWPYWRYSTRSARVMCCVIIMMLAVWRSSDLMMRTIVFAECAHDCCPLVMRWCDVWLKKNRRGRRMAEMILGGTENGQTASRKHFGMMMHMQLAPEQKWFRWFTLQSHVQTHSTKEHLRHLSVSFFLQIARDERKVFAWNGKGFF